MIKNIGYKKVATVDVNRATKKILETVGATLGPRGSNIIIREKRKDPFSTKDGVTVFKHLRFEDDEIDTVLQIIHQASQKTGDNAGDGTTTTAILACLILNNYKEAKKNTSDKKKLDNKYLFRKELETISKAHIDNIVNNFSKPIHTNEDIKRVATLSGNNNEYIGNLISTAYELVGINGNVMIDVNSKYDDEIEVVEGLQFKKGYSSPFFMTDHKKRISEINKPLILIYNGKINTVDGFIVPLQKASELGKPLLILSDDLGGEALATLVANHSNNIMQVNNVVIPGLGENRIDFLEDISAITGAKIIDPDKGHDLRNFNVSLFGKADKVVSTRLDTTIIGGKGTPEKIEERVNQILTQIDESVSPIERDYHQTRLDKLSGKLSLIKVGAFTVVEQKEKMDMIDDALKSVKSSIKSGISLGGGYTYLNSFEHDEKDITSNIYYKSIIDYIKLLVNNKELESEVIELLKKGNSEGYNLLTLEEGNLEDMGIIDSTAILVEVIKNAISVAGTLLISEVMLYPDNDAKPEPIDFM